MEWLHDLPADPKETFLTIQDVDQSSIKYISNDNTERNWFAPDGSLCVSESKLDLLDPGRITEKLMNILVQEVGVGLTHIKMMMIKN